MKLTGITSNTLNSFNVNAELQRGKYVPSAKISETLTSSNKLKVGQTFSEMTIVLSDSASHKKVTELNLTKVTVTSVTDSIVNGKKTQIASFSAQSFSTQWFLG